MSVISTRSQAIAQKLILERNYTSYTGPGDPLYPKLFSKITTDPKRSYATFQRYAEMGLLRPKQEGTAPFIDKPVELIPQTLEYFTYALAAEITEEAQMEDPSGWVAEIPKMLKNSEQATKEYLYHLMLNLAFAQNVLLADGQPLISGLHPLRPLPSATGIRAANGRFFSNSVGNSAITSVTLNNARILFKTLVSDAYMKDTRTPSYLVVPPELYQVAMEVTGSERKAYSNENTINTEYKGLEVVEDKYLSNPKAWFVMAKPNFGTGKVAGNGNSLVYSEKWSNRMKTWYDEPTSGWNMKTSFRALFGPLDWRGIVGSLGAL